ncbi:MAG: BON domain-containing protein [Thermodesulfobacteriota bacterium]
MRKVNISSGLIIFILLAAGFIGCAGSRTHESAGQYVDSSVITAKVKTALLADPDVSGLAIEVETFKDVVQLSGFVNSEEQARKAVEIARGVDGVGSVKNSLIVK